jgi:hypothetical protein
MMQLPAGDFTVAYMRGAAALGGVVITILHIAQCTIIALLRRRPFMLSSGIITAYCRIVFREGITLLLKVNVLASNMLTKRGVLRQTSTSCMSKSTALILLNAKL